MKSKISKKSLVFDRSHTLLCICDIIIDAALGTKANGGEYADTITTREIMHFLGVPENSLDNFVNEEYDLRKLRKVIRKKDSCALFEVIENKYLLQPV